MTYSCAVFERGDDRWRPPSAASTSAGLGAGRRRARHARAGDRHGLGRHGDAPAPARGAASPPRRSPGRRRRWPRDRSATRAWRPAVDVQLRDYRQLQGRYDAIVSVEMFEAVGERYWPIFFAACDRLLQPGGAVGLQTITMPHRRYLATRRTYSVGPQVRLPGRRYPVRAGHRRGGGARIGACASSADERDRPALRADPARCWRERFLARTDEVARARLRRHLPADVGVLPGLLRGRLRDRRARRRPAAAGAAGEARAAAGSGSPARRAGSARRCARELGRPRAPRGDQRPPRRPARRARGARDARRAARRHRPRRDASPRRRASRAELGGIDVAVLNAGLLAPVRPSTRGTRERPPPPLRDQPDGLAHGVEAVLPGMRRRGTGTIVGSRQRRRLPRLPQLRGLRRHQGGRDQPARVAADRPAAAGHHGADGLPGVRAHAT